MKLVLASCDEWHVAWRNKHMPSDLPSFSVSVIPFILLVFPYTVLYGRKRMLWWIYFPDCHCYTQVRECVGTRPIEHSFSDVIFVCYLHIVHKRNAYKVVCDCVLLRVWTGQLQHRFWWVRYESHPFWCHPKPLVFFICLMISNKNIVDT